MKTWVQPLAIVDKFVANEYVAACWTVSCQVPYENQGYDPFAPGNTNLLHRPDNCGATDGFTVFTNENNVAYKLVQGKAGGSSRTADLSGNIYSDPEFTKKIDDISSVQIGQTIYIRSQNGNKKWHHHGVVSTGTNHS